MSTIVSAYVAAQRRDPCSYCGGPNPTGVRDHIVARQHGGADGWENRTAACGSCNSSKKTCSLLGFLLWRRHADLWDAVKHAQEMGRDMRGVGV